MTAGNVDTDAKRKLAGLLDADDVDVNDINEDNEVDPLYDEALVDKQKLVWLLWKTWEKGHGKREIWQECAHQDWVREQEENFRKVKNQNSSDNDAGVDASNGEAKRDVEF